MKSVLALFLATGTVWTAAAEPRPSRLVVRDGYALPESWKPKKVKGQEFRTEWIWNQHPLQFVKQQKPAPTEAELKEWDLECLRNVAIEQVGWMGKVSPLKWKYPLGYIYTPTNELHELPYKLSSFFRPYVWRDMVAKSDPTRPLFINVGAARPIFLVEEAYCRPEMEEYLAWKRENPNFIGFKAVAEFDSDSRYFTMSPKMTKDPAIQKRVEANFKPPKDQWEWTALAKACYRRATQFYWGEQRLWTMCSSTYNLSHIMASAGAGGLMYEATGQGSARWQVAGAFLRGAARQFGLPTAWYAAHFFSGWTRDGKEDAGSNYWAGETGGLASSENGPYRGISPSLCDRQTAYGYLIGANFIERENAFRLYVDARDGRLVPHETLLNFEKLVQTAKRIPRGAVYSPCAVLVPASELTSPQGPQNYFDQPDWYSQSAFFTTLLPIHAEDLNQIGLRKRGDEGCLYNSKFGEFYDVLAPDVGQRPADFQSALGTYKCAFLLGTYRKEDLDVASLEAYVRDGGTLFVTPERVKEGLLPFAFTGVAFTGKTVASGTEVIDERGVRTALGDVYDWDVAEPGATAKVLMQDDRNQPVAYAHDVGKGRVVTVCAYKMLPRGYRETGMDKCRGKVIDMFAGKRTFSLIRALLERVQDETMPVSVAGDIQWGVNRTEKGWLAWLFNNKGVTHFKLEKPVVDPKATAHVTVTLKETGATFETDVPPGEWRLLPLWKN